MAPRASTMVGVAAGLQAASGIHSALQEQSYAAFQERLMSDQMEEIQNRTDMEIQAIRSKSEKVVASQAAAFMTGGVTLSGSAMNVISDTLNDAAKATYIRQREANYDLIGLGAQREQYRNAATDETLMLKVMSSTVGATTSSMNAMSKQGRQGTRNRGSVNADGIDAFGGTTGYSQDYMNS